MVDLEVYLGIGLHSIEDEINIFLTIHVYTLLCKHDYRSDDMVELNTRHKSEISSLQGPKSFNCKTCI